MDYFHGTDISLSIILSKDGEPFIPDMGSVKYSVYGHDGTPLAADVPVVTSSTTFQIQVEIAASANAIAPQRKFERRTVVVNSNRGGQYHRQTATYRLVPFLNFAIQASQVRGFIGVQEKELPDEDIDLVAAYLYVEKDFTDTRLAEALASGTTQELAANECIKLRAVLDVLPSIKQRIAQSEKNGIIGFERPTMTDFGEVERAAQDRYYSSKMEALGLTETAPVLILVTTDADPITGA